MRCLFVTMMMLLLACASGNLRKQQQQEEESSCNAAKDQESCFQTTDDASGLPCNWCACAAVPSECLSPDQSELVPSSIFDCQSPSSSHWQSHPFDFEPDQRHALRVNRGGEQLIGASPPEPAVSFLCDGSSKSLSGYMDISGSKYDDKGEDKHLFFWMFEKRGLKDSDDVGDVPLVVWLTGGPGCSGSLALLAENGPCSVLDADGATTKVNPYSWTEAAHVLWLDQPAGVGYSYGEETDKNEAMVSEDAYYFLQAFFETYPRYAKSPLYFIGESYGGHYTPAIAHRVLEGNKKASASNDLLHLNLSGIAIGNGLTKPEEQYKWYPEMMYKNSHGIEVIDESTYEALKADIPKCVSMIAECNKGGSFINTFACQSAFAYCNNVMLGTYQQTGLNPYDIRLNCEQTGLCYDFSPITKFLNKESTKKALGVDSNKDWATCNGNINSKFHVDWMKDFSGYVATLLEHDIPALIYAGDVDFVCNYLGNRAWTLGLDWSGGEDFRAAPETPWQESGLVRSAKGFTFYQVYDAGHMVPMDQPQVALNMLETFLAKGKLE